MDSQLSSRSFPGYSRLYWLFEPGASRAFRATLEITHEEALTLLMHEATRDEPIRARWAMGASKPGDVIWTTLAVPVLISERVLGILRDGRFAGWDVTPVELRGKTGEILPRYYFLCVSGRCGRIDYGKSELIDKIYPAGVFPAWKGLYFDPATWDGSDLFIPDESAFICVVEAVKDILLKAKVKDILFESLDDVEFSS